MMKMDELKPCPFCGGTAIMREIPGRMFFVHCDCCLVETDCEDSPEDAAKVWNRRAAGKTNMPIGAIAYAIACRICKNRNSDKCHDCKMEIESGFELDEDALKEALADG